MASPARLHKQRETARLAAQAAAQAEQPVSGNAFDLSLAQLAQHKRQLGNIQSMQARLQKKAELMQEWQGYIDGVLTADSGAIDPIISQLMPWAFDVGNIEQALAIGAYLLRHNLPAPEHFVRDLPSLYAEMAAESWLNTAPGETPTISASQLDDVLERTLGYDMVDEIRAKLHRALGEALVAVGNRGRAIEHLKRAVTLNPKVGAKGLLSRLEKEHPPQT